MPWIYLFIAGILEIFWAIALKESDGFSKILPSALMIVGLAGSMVLLAIAMRSIPMGTAYPVWVGIGALGTAAAGMIRYGEPASALRMMLIILLVGSIVGLKLTSTPLPISR
ncbi:quaternary ammonium compound efflux SMR transporter SugE [soil metagenome]